MYNTPSTATAAAETRTVINALTTHLWDRTQNISVI